MRNLKTNPLREWRKWKLIPFLLAVFLCFLEIQCGNSKSVPDEFLGVWEGSGPAYEDCYFELRKDAIVFENRKEPETYSENTIVRFEETKGKTGIFYTITYRGEEELEYKFHFYHDPSNGGSIRLRNKPDVRWKKKAGEAHSDRN